MKTRLTCLAMMVLASLLAGCHFGGYANIPPAGQVAPPGPAFHGPGPGVSGPGPGVIPPSAVFGEEPPLGETQVLFSKPEGMQVRWDTGDGMFAGVPLIVPGRGNFQQGGIYRLKLTNIPNREGVELYPTLEIGPATPRTRAFLAHNALPVQITPEDFDQVLSGNFVTKVVYLPDPEFQELALAGVETLVSTRLEPGVDPVVEADRRGAILGIIRLGNKDVELPGGGGVILEDGGVAPAGFQGAPGGGPVPFAIRPAAYGSAPTSGHHAGAAYPSAQLAPGGAGIPPSDVAGAPGVQWGTPITCTPLGLPGPVQLPFGFPAGLQHHTTHNHQTTYRAGPASHMGYHIGGHH